MSRPKDYARMWLDGGGDPTFDQIDGFLLAHYNARAIWVDEALLRQAKDALWEWAEQTHGNEFGHDHHCKFPGSYLEAWTEAPGDPERCSCGWTKFRVAYDAWAKARIEEQARGSSR